MQPVDGQTDGPVDVENIIRGTRDQTRLRLIRGTSQCDEILGMHAHCRASD